MDDNRNEDVEQGSSGDVERRLYRTPTLRFLGNVQSVVQHTTSMVGGDGGDVGTSYS